MNVFRFMNVMEVNSQLALWNMQSVYILFSGLKGRFIYMEVWNTMAALNEEKCMDMGSLNGVMAQHIPDTSSKENYMDKVDVFWSGI